MPTTPTVMSPRSGYDGSRVHSPNENIRLEDYLRGSQAIADIIMALGIVG